MEWRPWRMRPVSRHPMCHPWEWLWPFMASRGLCYLGPHVGPAWARVNLLEVPMSLSSGSQCVVHESDPHWPFLGSMEFCYLGCNQLYMPPCLILIPGKCACKFCLIGQAIQWRHNGRDGVSDHQPRDCSFNRLFRRGSKETSKLRMTGLCVGNSTVTGEFPAQRASYAENVSIWWRHHDDQHAPQSLLTDYVLRSTESEFLLTFV